MSNSKKLFCVLVCLVFTTGCGASPEKELAGVWKGTDQFGQTMKFTLETDGQLKLHVDSQNQSFSKYGTYHIDLSTEPAHFDIKLQDRDEINTILERIDEQHIAFESINSGDERPVKFGDRTIVLERQ